MITATLGLAVLFEAVPLLYTAAKLPGALYPVWIGARLILAPARTHRPDPAPTHPAFWQSVTFEMLNLKTALSFLAFLPQFTDPEAAFPIWLQMMALGTIMNLTFSTADVVCVLFADRVAGARAQRPPARG